MANIPYSKLYEELEETLHSERDMYLERVGNLHPLTTTHDEDKNRLGEEYNAVKSNIQYLNERFATMSGEEIRRFPKILLEDLF